MANLEKRFNNFLERNNYFRGQKPTPVSEADLKCAENFVRMMFLATPEDYLLFFSSLILLSSNNKTIKGPKKDKRYSFKELVTDAVDAAIQANEDYIKFCCISDKNGLPITYVKIFDVQFSYHNVSESPLMTWARKSSKPQYEKQIWEHLPMQNGAQKLFNYALEQPLTRIYMDGTGANPRDIVVAERRKAAKLATQAIALAGVQSGKVNINKITKTSEAEFGN